MDITLLTCVYNTPFLIEPLFKSFDKHNEYLNVKKVVAWASNNPVLMDEEEEIFKKLKINKVICCPGMVHGEAVNRALKQIDTRYVLLVDSDVLFLKDIGNIFQKIIHGNFTLGGEVVGNRGGKSLYPRVQPWFCFIDLNFLKDNNIIFFDFERTKLSKKSGNRVYDIGSTMYEDVLNADGMIANFCAENKYFKHYEGMSWYVQKYLENAPDTDIDFGGTHPHKSIYEHGINVKNQYLQDIIHI